MSGRLSSSSSIVSSSVRKKWYFPSLRMNVVERILTAATKKEGKKTNKQKNIPKDLTENIRDCGREVL